MPLISLVIVLIVIGVLLWAVEKYIPMDATIKRVIQAVVIIVTILWVLNALGVLGAAKKVQVPRVSDSGSEGSNPVDRWWNDPWS